jgi:hypothetical protein
LPRQNSKKGNIQKLPYVYLFKMEKIFKIMLAIVVMLIASLLLAWLHITMDLANNKAIDGFIKITVLIATIYLVRFIWNYRSRKKKPQ